MSLVKCLCNHCKGHLEFDEQHAGEQVSWRRLPPTQAACLPIQSYPGQPPSDAAPNYNGCGACCCAAWFASRFVSTVFWLCSLVEQSQNGPKPSTTETHFGQCLQGHCETM